MFGIKIISDREYQEMVSDNQTLSDRVGSLEAQLQSKIYDLECLGGSIEAWEKNKGLEYQREAQKLRSKYSELENTVKKIDPKIQGLRRENVNLINAISEHLVAQQLAQRELDKITLERDRLKKEIEDKDHYLQCDIKRHIEEFGELKSKFDTAIAHNLEQDTMLKSNAETIAELRANIERDHMVMDLLRADVEKAIAEKSQAEQLHNEATIQLGLAIAKLQNYRLSTKIAVDNLIIAIDQITS